MTRLAWDAAGERLFELGIDRAVFYPDYTPKGVPWNGVVSVNQAPSGGEITSLYLDGERFNQLSETEEFTATLTAYTYPPEFSAFDGTAEVGHGMYVDQQPRDMFHLTYRTLIGNDVVGDEYGYKLHFVYNAIAAPITRGYVTQGGQQAGPTGFAWNLQTAPVKIPGFKMAAHYIVDSTKIDPYVLKQLEDILYGSAFANPRMPTASELQKFLATAVVVTVVDHGDGSWTATGPDDIIYMITNTEFVIDWKGVSMVDDVTYQLSSG